MMFQHKHTYRCLATAVVVAAIAPQASAQFIEGIDTSHWQGTVNWTAVKNDGIEFAFTKATEGVNFVDSRFHQNMQGATAAGVLIGPYHFTRIDSFNGVPFTSYDGSPFVPGTNPYNDALGEANDFLEAIQPYYNTGLYLPPVADVEGLPDFNSQSLERTFISNWMQIFSDTINDALGVRPLIYTSKFGANTRFTSEFAAQHELWLAWWKGTGTTNPPVQSDTPIWNDWQFWQWTDSWSVSGIGGAVDGDVFAGTQQELEALLIGDGSNPGGSTLQITNFEVDEGYFGWAYNHSGSTSGLGTGTTIDRVTTEAQDGVGSQEINIDGDPNGWLLRHLSGIGGVANPASNLALTTTGHVGFWLKTTDPGITVQVAVDDPVTGDRGLVQDVIADGQWHLYEWDLENDDEWEAWFNGDGIITGPTVSLDSIQFRGNGDAVIYLDSVAHNPDGSMAPLVADFDNDGDVDADDMAQWQADFGVNGGSDADGDGDSDGQDFILWLANLTLAETPGGSQPVPEPAAATLAATAAALIALRRRRRLFWHS